MLQSNFFSLSRQRGLFGMERAEASDGAAAAGAPLATSVRRLRRLQDAAGEPFLEAGELSLNSSGSVPPASGVLKGVPSLTLCLNILGLVLGTVKEPSVVALQGVLKTLAASSGSAAQGKPLSKGTLFTALSPILTVLGSGNGAPAIAFLPPAATSITLLPRVRLSAGDDRQSIIAAGRPPVASALEIAGAVIGGLLGLCCLGLLGLLLWRRRSPKVAPAEEPLKDLAKEPEEEEEGEEVGLPSAATAVSTEPEAAAVEGEEEEELNINFMVAKAEALTLQAKRAAQKASEKVMDKVQKLDHLGRPDKTFQDRQRAFRELQADKKRKAAEESLKGASLMQRILNGGKAAREKVWHLAKKEGLDESAAEEAYAHQMESLVHLQQSTAKKIEKAAGLKKAAQNILALGKTGIGAIGASARGLNLAGIGASSRGLSLATLATAASANDRIAAASTGTGDAAALTEEEGEGEEEEGEVEEKSEKPPLTEQQKAKAEAAETLSKLDLSLFGTRALQDKRLAPLGGGGGR
jgi:hypothetical protein